MKEKDYADAFRHFRRAIQMDDAIPAIWTNLGMIYDTMSHHQHAIDAYHLALSLHLTSSPYLFTLPKRQRS